MSTPSNSNSSHNCVQELPVPAFLAYCRLTGARDRPVACGPRASAVPLVDVRSPCEYMQGHIPGAVNLPLFSDEERALVGTLYREQGREEAFFRGLAIVGPKMEFFARRAREIAGTEREAALYCSRGGMRSGSLGWLFAQAGIRAHVLEGGYKAFRRHVLAFFEAMRASPFPRLLVLGGRTGSGKTEVLRLMAGRGIQVLDLEGMARHRGSAFGALNGVVQPSCEHFSNRLALALAQCDLSMPVWVEDESENIGSANQPEAFYRLLRSSPLAVLEVPRPLRLKRVLEEYGNQPKEEMEQALDRIKKRLGGLEHKRAHEFLDKGDLPSLAGILLDYYDKAYDKQIHKRAPFAEVHAESPDQAAERLIRLGAGDARTVNGAGPLLLL